MSSLSNAPKKEEQQVSGSPLGLPPGFREKFVGELAQLSGSAGQPSLIEQEGDPGDAGWPLSNEEEGDHIEATPPSSNSKEKNPEQQPLSQEPQQPIESDPPGSSKPKLQEIGFSEQPLEVPEAPPLKTSEGVSFDVRGGLAAVLIPEQPGTEVNANVGVRITNDGKKETTLVGQLSVVGPKWSALVSAIFDRASDSEGQEASRMTVTASVRVLLGGDKNERVNFGNQVLSALKVSDNEVMNGSGLLSDEPNQLKLIKAYNDITSNAAQALTLLEATGSLEKSEVLLIARELANNYDLILTAVNSAENRENLVKVFRDKPIATAFSPANGLGSVVSTASIAPASSEAVALKVLRKFAEEAGIELPVSNVKK